MNVNVSETIVVSLLWIGIALVGVIAFLSILSICKAISCIIKQRDIKFAIAFMICGVVGLFITYLALF